MYANQPYIYLSEQSERTLFMSLFMSITISDIIIMLYICFMCPFFPYTQEHTIENSILEKFNVCGSLHFQF